MGALVERARKESAFADDVEANLAGFVAKRPDLFGSVDEQIREAAEAGAEAAARDAGADAGPAHTMVPPTAQALSDAKTAGKLQAALPSGPAAATPALAGVGMAGLPVGSMVNSRLPGTSVTPQPTVQSKAAMTAPPSGMALTAGDEESDDEPDAKKPRLDDG